MKRRWTALLLLAGCTVDPGDTGGVTPVDETGDVAGIIFKGPMQADGVVTLQALDVQGQEVGDPVEVVVTDAAGSYTVTGVRRGLVRVTAEGGTLNEASGEVDARPLQLRAFAEVGGPTQDVHVNLVTDLTFRRVETLLAEGLAPPDAIRQAQDELRAALPIGAGRAPEGQGEATDPYDGGFDASWLFAFSGVFAEAGLQFEADGLGTIADVMYDVREDLADDGDVLDAVRELVRGSESRFNPDLATTSLDTHADDNALDLALPDPHPALDSDHDGVANDEDNCRYVDNADQSAEDGLTFGEACDYRLAAISTSEDLGCAVLAETQEITWWAVAAEPIGGSPPRPDAYPQDAVAPWAGDAFASGGWREVATGDGIVCAVGEAGVSCWEEGEPTDTPRLDGDFESVVVNEELVCGVSSAQAVSCSRRADGEILELGAAVQVAPLGGGAVCLLTSDGKIGCYDEDGGRLSLPDQPDGTFRKIAGSASGVGWACALDEAGAVACFGSSALTAAAPTGSGYLDLAVGASIACVASGDGVTTCWRDEAVCPDVGEAPPGLTRLTAGECQVCGVDPNGLGACWPRAWDVAHPPS